MVGTLQKQCILEEAMELGLGISRVEAKQDLNPDGLA